MMMRRDVLQAQFRAADTAEDFNAVATLGQQLQSLQVESAQLSLSEEEYLTLPGRHADLVLRLTEKCKELTRAKDYAAVTALGAKLGELRAVTWPAMDAYTDARRATGMLFYCPCSASASFPFF
jgi:hypothetical protein